MFNRLVPINYELVAAHLMDRLHDPDIPGQISFERIFTYLDNHAETMLVNPEDECDEVEDRELTEILLDEYVVGSIQEITVTKVPGIIVPVGDHLLMLPLVLIKF